MRGPKDEAMTFTITRAIAALAIVLHHWLLYLPWEQSPSFSSAIVLGICGLSGTFVQVFFVLSGYGLVLSYYRKPSPWIEWAKHRAAKILLPYWIIVFVTFVYVNWIGHDYSWQTLFRYVTLTRNFYEPRPFLNPVLWFMPVIVGCYLSFPFLMKVLEERGPKVLLGLSLLTSYAYIATSMAFGVVPMHHNAFLMSFLGVFSLGMVLAYAHTKLPSQFSWLNGPKGFLIGAAFYGLSWIITKAWEHGSSFNDVFTAAGLCMMMLCFEKMMGNRLHGLFKKLAHTSYILYLVHYPIIIFVVGSVWNKHTPAILSLASGLVFSFLLAAIVFLVLSLWGNILVLIRQFAMRLTNG